MPTKTISATATSLLAAIGGPMAAFAHHSWSAEYDLSRSTSISGNLARMLIQNPHSALTLLVSTDNGRQERWTVEWGSPQRLRDRGVTNETLRVGEALFVTGNPHRDPEVRSIRAVSVRRSDGSEVGRDNAGGG